MTSWINARPIKRIFKEKIEKKEKTNPINILPKISNVDSRLNSISDLEKCYMPYFFDNNPMLINLIESYKDKFKNRNITKIINVYKPIYICKGITTKADGIGDFVRGTYCLEQICNILDILFDTYINHPINKLINYNTIHDVSNNTIRISLLNQYIGDSIHFLSNPTNYFTFINELLNICLECPILNNTIYVYCGAFPLFKISDESKNIMKNRLLYNSYTESFIVDIMNKYNLIKNKYNIIHIRSGDSFILNKDTLRISDYSIYLQNIVKIIRPISSLNTLLLCDSNIIKNYISEKIPLIIIKNKITHLGLGILTDENVINTMIDFYLFSFSNSIISFSCYMHGSGFGKWCAETYSIPYKCFYFPS